jgi:hypothetical protein
VATIDAMGLATGVTPGTTSITADSGEAQGTATLVVLAPQLQSDPQKAIITTEIEPSREDLGRLQDALDAIFGLRAHVAFTTTTVTRTALSRLYDTYQEHAEGLRSTAVDGYFLAHLLRIGRKGISEQGEEEAAVQTIQILGRMGASGPAGLAAENIDILGFAALRRDAEPAVRQMIDSLRVVFESTGDQEPRKAVLDAYRDLVKQLAAGYRERLLRHLVTTLVEMANAARSAEDPQTEARCLEMLEPAGHDAAVSLGILPSRKVSTVSVRSERVIE